jgi:hypothetical protein
MSPSGPNLYSTTQAAIVTLPSVVSMYRNLLSTVNALHMHISCTHCMKKQNDQFRALDFPTIHNNVFFKCMAYRPFTITPPHHRCILTRKHPPFFNSWLGAACRRVCPC